MYLLIRSNSAQNYVTHYFLCHSTQFQLFLSEWKWVNIEIIIFNCAVVSPKPGHMNRVRDFDFMLNLFSLPSPWNHYLFLRRIPYHSLWSHPRNRPPVNSRERQSLAAATVPQRFGHCICSQLKYVECTKYVRIQARTRACEQSVHAVCVPGWFIK